jgi:dihydroxy-acid dehydratase
MLVSDAELAKRKKAGKPKVRKSETPWQELYRKNVAQLSEGMVLKPAVKYRRVARTVPRDNH